MRNKLNTRVSSSLNCTYYFTFDCHKVNACILHNSCYTSSSHLLWKLVYVFIQIFMVDVTCMLVVWCMLFVQNEHQLRSVRNSSNEILAENEP